jgi:hypothetical protein
MKEIVRLSNNSHTIKCTAWEALFSNYREYWYAGTPARLFNLFLPRTTLEILMSTASLVELKSLDTSTAPDARATTAIDSAAPASADRPAASNSDTPTTGVVAFLGGKRMIAAAITGAALTLVWLTLFTLGLCVNTEPFRTRLTNLAGTGEESTISILEALVVVAFTYTPTNLVHLCCASSLIGCLGRLATTNGNARSSPQAGDNAKSADDSDPAGISPLSPAISAVMWGFFVYLVLISGTIVLAGDSFTKTDPEQYFRLAGSASLLAFAVGWQPQIVTQLVSNIGNAKLGRSGKAEKAASTR